MLRFIALLLISICFTNSLWKGESAIHLGEVSSQQESYHVQDAGSGIDAAPIMENDQQVVSAHAPSRDLDSHGFIHDCHLGHCQFLVAGPEKIIFSQGTALMRYAHRQSLISATLSRIVRPPIAS